MAKHGSRRVTGCSGFHCIVELGRKTGSGLLQWAAFLRRSARKPVRRGFFFTVVVVTTFSVFVTQTQAYLEYYRAVEQPTVTSLSAGSFGHILHYASTAWRAASGWATGLLTVTQGPNANLGLSPAGMPHAWQPIAVAAPYSLVNMANGNVLTRVPVVGWQSLGSPIQFCLFHNTLGSEPGQASLGEKWTHSYGRHLVHDLNSNTFLLFTDEGGSLLFSPEAGNSGVYRAPPGIHLVLRTPTPPEVVTTVIYKNQDQDVFDETGRLIAVVDASGNASNMEYDSWGRLSAVRDPAGNELSLAYDQNGRLKRITAPPIGLGPNPIQRVFEIAHVPSTELPPDTTDILRVSTARRGGGGNPADDPPLFWADFHTNGPQLTAIVDYALAVDESGEPDADSRPKAVLTYSATSGRIVTSTLGVGDLNEQTRTFTFTTRQPVGYGVMCPSIPAPSPNGTGTIQRSPIRFSSVQGARTIPSPDITRYYFDVYERLSRLQDAEDRSVLQVCWDAANNPFRITNVLGGTTCLTFDDSGNVLRVAPPVGGAWTYEYDALNNLTQFTDPMGYQTSLTYDDPVNPTRPTLVDGPGVSDVTLEWGQTLGHDRGKLVRTLSPNGIEQTFSYWADPNPENGQPDGLYGVGQLLQRTFGRGFFREDESGREGDKNDVNPYPCITRPAISDGVWFPDFTGHVNTWSAAAFPSDGSTFADASFVYPSMASCSGGSPVNATPVGDTCSTTSDADGNDVPCMDCGPGGPGLRDSGGAFPALFNGKRQPVWLPQPLAHTWSGSCSAGYRFEYDVFGRKTLEQAITQTEGFLCPDPQPHMYVYLDHRVTWHYDDERGTTTRVYSRQELANHEGGSITTITATDRVGRVTQITQGGQATVYAYTDSTVLPAVVETKFDGTVTEYYLDLAGQVSRIVHKDAGGMEVLGFRYFRDAKGRVTQIVEYVNGQQIATTAYTYGDGRLVAAELDADSASQIEPDKLYYSWFAALSPKSFQPGDPNRLVKEVRTGDSGYYREYRYDAGGNRLVKLEKENYGTSGSPDWRPSRIVRYNYAYLPNCSRIGLDYDWSQVSRTDPRIAANPSLRLGEPDPLAFPDELGYPWSYNTYEAEDPQHPGEVLGQDKLLSYTEYFFDGNGQPIADQPPVYTLYEYAVNGGSMSRKMSWDGRTRTQIEQHFTYDRQRLQSVVVNETTWPPLPANPEDPAPMPDLSQDREQFAEIYGYNVFGERIGVYHCTALTLGGYENGLGCGFCFNCSKRVRVYDYVDGQLLVERESTKHCGPHERFVSVYTWGPFGLIARRGVSVRNGCWDANAPASGPEEGLGLPGCDRLPQCAHCTREAWSGPCDPNDPQGPQYGGFVAVDPNAMRNYTYMADHMGNIVALVDASPASPTYGEARRQVFDAFGVNVGGYITFRCDLDCDYNDDPWHLFCGHFGCCPGHGCASGPGIGPSGWSAPPCPNDPARPVERMQTGGFNWRGGEGSVTDRVLEDMQDSATHELRWSAYTRPSTGLIYMQARYYDPETGRFTQHDPVPYGMEVLWGQSNRWAYCADDPVNGTDPSGLWISVVLGIGAAAAFSFGLLAGYSVATNSASWGATFLTAVGVAGGFALTGGSATNALMAVLLGWQVELGLCGLAASPLGPVVGIALMCLSLFAIGFAMGYLIGEIEH